MQSHLYFYTLSKIELNINVKLKITFDSKNYKTQLQVRNHSGDKYNSTWDRLMLVCIHGWMLSKL